MELVAFAIFAAAALGSALVVVGHRNPVYSTLALVVTLLATAGLFVMLGSPFLAALQVLLYTGAILVLFLFVIMLLNVRSERPAGARATAQTWVAGVGALVLFGALSRLFWEAHGADTAPPLTEEFTSTKGIAELLFSTYLLPFEIIGLLLLVAIVAASWVARRSEEGDETLAAAKSNSAPGGDTALATGATVAMPRVPTDEGSGPSDASRSTHSRGHSGDPP